MVMERVSQIGLIVLSFILLVLLVLGLAVSCQPLQAESQPTETPTLAPTMTPVDTPTPDLVKTTPDPNAPGEATAAAPTGSDTTNAPGEGDAPETAPDAAATAEPEAPAESSATAVPDGGAGGLPVPGATVRHTVSEGEWLLQIARCYGASYGGVLRSNWIPFPDLIYPGDVLTIPNAGSEGSVTGPPCVVRYQVAAGDTWDGLAQRYGTTTAILQRANPGPLTVGVAIWVPRLP